MNSPSRSRLPIVVGALVVLVAIAVGGFLYLTRDTSDPELKLSETTGTTGAALAPGALDGSWTVVPGKGPDTTVAGYRVKEVFAAGARRSTADGRTPDVSGALTVAGGSVTTGSFTVDMTTLQSDQSRRDNAIRSRGLQTNEFPQSTFALTGPVKLPVIKKGGTFQVRATGDLTLHGVTRSITLDLTGRSSGDLITVQGSAPVVMADYGIEPPSVGGFVKVDDNGTIEFIVNFAKA